ncbi:SCAN domain-containing protein 3 [Trichonephila clavipes]|nr:SCAN domain-containing protein 3 [Trichonephila clavipes]
MKKIYLLLTKYHIKYHQSKKPLTITEELILPPAIEIVETISGDNFAKELQSISLSNDTVFRLIDDIVEDVEQQLLGKLRDKLFSIQLEDATDRNKEAHFISYVRLWDAEVDDEFSAQKTKSFRILLPFSTSYLL